MDINAAQHLMNQAPFSSTFPILVIAKIFDGVYVNNEKFSYLVLRIFACITNVDWCYYPSPIAIGCVYVCVCAYLYVS